MVDNDESSVVGCQPVYARGPMVGTDWRKVELDYRSGIMSINMVCRVHDISRSTLMNKAANEGWSRDLMTQVRAEVNERLYMNRRLEAGQQDHVTIAAQVVIDTIYAHRNDISQLRNTVTRVLDQVNDLLDINILDEGALDKSKVILRNIQGSLLLGKTQGIVNALDTLASAYQRVITMERQAFGLEGISSASFGSDNEPATLPAATVQVYLPANNREPIPG